MQTFSTEHFDIRIDSGLLEMRTEGAGLASMGASAERTLSSMLRLTAVNAVCLDIRASMSRDSDQELVSRIRQIGRLCRGLPIAFIGRRDQSAQIDEALRTHRQMGELSQAFRQRCKAHEWLKAAVRGK